LYGDSKKRYQISGYFPNVDIALGRKRMKHAESIWLVLGSAVL